MRLLKNAIVLNLLTLLAVSSACGSPGAARATDAPAPDAKETLDWNVRPARRATKGVPVRLKYVDFGSGQSFELVNESHSDPIEAYSRRVAAGQAYTKVQADEALEALLERIEDHGGLSKFQPGQAPVYPLRTRAKALELERANGPTCWVVYEASTPAEREAFLKCAKDFVDLYNATMQMQAVDGAPAWGQNPGRPAPRKAAGSGRGQ